MPFLRNIFWVIQAFDKASELYQKEQPMPPPLPQANDQNNEVAARLEARYQEELRKRQEAERLQAQFEEELHQMRKAAPETDAYSILGVTEKAPDFIVKAAYKAAARHAHADAGGSDAKMSKLNQAYSEIAQRRGWK